MNMMDDMKVKVAIITTQEVQIKDFISFNFQWRPLENFDILQDTNRYYLILQFLNCVIYLWFARWQGLEVNMHVDDDVVFWGWNTTANQPPRLSTDGKKSSKKLNNLN
jgi:hypothetical protein